MGLAEQRGDCLRRFAKLYDRKTPITAADLLNDRVIPFHEEHGMPLQRVLTDRGTEYCGNPERHECELYLAVEDIDHTRTEARSPQTNGIVERFHKTMLDEFYRIAFRKKAARTRGSGASARCRCKHSLTPCRWRAKNQVTFKPARKATPAEATTASSHRLSD
jgi:transposase InsO family protein